MRKGLFLAKFNTIPLPIKAPYHAPHLFSDDNIESILSTTSLDHWASHCAAIPTVSSATGEFIWARDFRSLLRAAVDDILVRPLRWDKLSQRLGLIAGAAQGMPIIMHQIAVSAEGTFNAAVKQRGCDAPLVLDQSRSLPQPDFVNSSALKVRAMAKTLSSSSPTGRPDKSNIAVIGASGRFPDAEDMTSFWDLLYQGRDVHKMVPPLHWDAKTHVDPTGKSKNTSATPFGCWLDHPELFDAKFFNISPREAPQIDPAQRLALLTAYEAIEDAGIVPGATPSTQKDRVGVFYGVTSNDWMETNSAQNIDAYFIPGGNRAFIPGRINYFFRFSGPSFSVDTACSSSLAAIHVACNALWRGEIDTAIAGGTNVLTNPDFTAGLDKGHFLSRTGNCKTFDNDADGYCRGEGVATVILKRLEDAIADKDPIQALILGGYTNHSAEAESITRPLVAAQKEIFRKVLNGAGVDPYDIGYVEMHGTGTQAGDAAEMRSVLETFAADGVLQKRNGEQALYVGSAKVSQDAMDSVYSTS
jgi:3-oxoacyl-(acyl-carrier-protein) synthase